MYYTVLYCTVMSCTALYCTVLRSVDYHSLLYPVLHYINYTVLYCTVLYCTVLYCTVLYCTVLSYPVLLCPASYCIILYCTILYYTVLLHLVLPCIALSCHDLWYPGTIIPLCSTGSQPLSFLSIPLSISLHLHFSISHILPLSASPIPHIPLHFHVTVPLSGELGRIYTVGHGREVDFNLALKYLQQGAEVLDRCRVNLYMSSHPLPPPPPLSSSASSLPTLSHLILSPFFSPLIHSRPLYCYHSPYVFPSFFITLSSLFSLLSSLPQHCSLHHRIPADPQGVLQRRHEHAPPVLTQGGLPEQHGGRVGAGSGVSDVV
jgi:hypothetical protein